MEKKILIASFIFPERLEWFLGYLDKSFNIKRNTVFIYKNLDDEAKVIVTFKLTMDENKTLRLNKAFPSAIPIHKKGDALYTINALNRLIDADHPESIGNTDYKSIVIDWSKYQNKFIILRGEDLLLLNIERMK